VRMISTRLGARAPPVTHLAPLQNSKALSGGVPIAQFAAASRQDRWAPAAAMELHTCRVLDMVLLVVTSEMKMLGF
jgi:hypothetical protein